METETSFREKIENILLTRSAKDGTEEIIEIFRKNKEQAMQPKPIILEKERLRQESEELFNNKEFQESLDDVKEGRLYLHEDVKKELNIIATKEMGFKKVLNSNMFEEILRATKEGRLREFCNKLKNE